ncbi:MAG TPA: hypothetical protein VGN01_20815 [Acidobacteriaceae bacterium]|jgi:hypothetical protein
MYTRLDRAHRAIPVVLGFITLAGVLALLVWDIAPALFPARAHDLLGAFPLAMIAVAYLVYQSVHRPSAMEWFKAILLAVAFLFWAANQCWPDPHQATVFNDIAIALFVLDVFLVMIGWPAASPDESFAETYAQSPAPSTHRDPSS